jgi:hypothetical protein
MIDQDIGLKLDKLFEGTGQGLHFESCKVGIETTNNNTGFFALIDSTAKNVGILWNAAASPTAQGSIVLENVQVDNTVGSVSNCLSFEEIYLKLGRKRLTTSFVRPLPLEERMFSKALLSRASPGFGATSMDLLLASARRANSSRHLALRHLLTLLELITSPLHRLSRSTA